MHKVKEKKKTQVVMEFSIQINRASQITEAKMDFLINGDVTTANWKKKTPDPYLISLTRINPNI